MRKHERLENAVLTVRFSGEQLETRGVSIYDLGDTLISVQRMIHKAFLAQNERLTKGAFPTRDERRELSLQLGERRRGSDLFALVPILTDQFVRDSLQQVVQYVISGVVGYYVGDVLDRVKKEKDANARIYIGSIYTEVANITNRIDAVGGLEAVSLGSPVLGKENIATFDNSTKDYLSDLRKETYLGVYQTIKGRVYKLYPASKIVAIKRAGGRTVSIFLSDENFDLIRYTRETTPWFRFSGRPVFRFGIETKAVSEFEAESVEQVHEEEEED